MLGGVGTRDLSLCYAESHLLRSSGLVPPALSQRPSLIQPQSICELELCALKIYVEALTPVAMTRPLYGSRVLAEETKST